MGISFKNHSGSFRSTPRPWDHLPPEPGAPMCAPRSDPHSLPTRNILFRHLRFTPKVIPLSPKFKEKDEPRRDCLEYYTKLKPKWGEATGAEGPLPSTPQHLIDESACRLTKSVICSRKGRIDRYRRDITRSGSSVKTHWSRSLRPQ